MVYDRTGSANPYLKFQHLPLRDHCHWYTVQAPHASGMNVLMWDAHVHQVNSRVSPGTWHAAVTPDKTDLIGGDW